MKSFLKPHVKQEELKYPCLKESNNLEGQTIVLFTDYDSGICVHTTAPQNYVGMYSEDWMEEIFFPFNGEVIIKN
jgi:hypothetical protein